MKSEHKLRAKWDRRQRDLMIHWPAGESTNSDAHWLSGVLGKEFTDELERRGYALSTLKFSIEPRLLNQRFASQRPCQKPEDE